ncbi:MAG TPA: hypothetical protein VGL59_15080 [Polyangia bacterium]
MCFAATLLWSGGRGFAADEETKNACGCRQDSAGTCYCDHKSKCGCPGECEPKGCEEKRAKQLDKEIQLETKKAESQGHKKQPANSDERAPRDQDAAKNPSSKGQGTLAPHMSAGQRQQLAKLLELYVTDRPEARQSTIDQVRIQLVGTDKH